MKAKSSYTVIKLNRRAYRSLRVFITAFTRDFIVAIQSTDQLIIRHSYRYHCSIFQGYRAFQVQRRLEISLIFRFPITTCIFDSSTRIKCQEEAKFFFFLFLSPRTQTGSPREYISLRARIELVRMSFSTYWIIIFDLASQMAFALNLSPRRIDKPKGTLRRRRFASRVHRNDERSHGLAGTRCYCEIGARRFKPMARYGAVELLAYVSTTGARSLSRPARSR